MLGNLDAERQMAAHPKIGEIEIVILYCEG